MNGNLGSGRTVNRPVKEGNPYLDVSRVLLQLETHEE
jgi:hypothetical protein